MQIIKDAEQEVVNAFKTWTWKSGTRGAKDLHAYIGEPLEIFKFRIGP